MAIKKTSLEIEKTLWDYGRKKSKEETGKPNFSLYVSKLIIEQKKRDELTPRNKN